MPNYTGAKLTLSGDRDLKRLFDELPRRVIKKGLRQAMNAAANPILRAARRGANKLTGLLGKSLKKKVKAYPNGNVIAVVGADRAVTAVVNGKNRVPANYIHLVEKGHGGPAPAPGSFFLESAYENNRAAAVAVAEGKLRAVVEAEALKLGKR